MNKGYRVLTFCFTLLVFYGLNSYGQEDTTGFVGFKTFKMPLVQHVLKSNIIPVFEGQIYFCGEIRITYEHPIAHNQSMLVGISYNFPNLAILLFDPSLIKSVSIQGARGILGYRIYPLKNSTAPKGFFFGPYLSYNFAKITEKSARASYEIINYLNASMTSGYQVVHKHFSFEVFGGLGYRNNFALNYDARLNHFSQGALPQILNLGNFKYVKLIAQMNFGYAF